MSHMMRLGSGEGTCQPPHLIISPITLSEADRRIGPAMFQGDWRDVAQIDSNATGDLAAT